MARGFDIRITQIERSKSGAMILVSTTVPKSFDFQEGQFLFLSKEFSGQTMSRHYSIACSYQDFQDHQELVFGISKIEGGVFSSWFMDEAQPGDTLRALGPFGLLGRFVDQARNFLFISTGSGYAPLLGMYNKLIQSGAYDKIANIYGTRTKKDMPESLLQSYSLQSSRIHNHIYLSKTAYESSLSKNESGYVQEALDEALSFVGRAGLLVVVSGSGKMTQDVVYMLKHRGVADDQIVLEDYGAW